MIKRILLGCAVFVAASIAVLLVLVLRQPAEFSVSRTTGIAAAPDAVYAQVNDFRNWQDWSPWAELDPDATISFEGAESGTGAIFRWSGNQEVGEGSQEIVESRPGEMVRIQLVFVKPFAGTSETEFAFQPESGGTLVTWTMRGRNDFVGKCISLVMDCETMLGPQFEKGLANLKATTEKVL